MRRVLLLLILCSAIGTSAGCYKTIHEARTPIAPLQSNLAMR